MDGHDRLAELKGKPELTPDEFAELVKLSPPGSFTRLPLLADIGVRNLDRAMANFEESSGRVQHAFDCGCYVEVLALLAQHSEFWLRMYWVARNPRQRVFSDGDRRTLGQVVNECADLGLDQAIVERVRAFNRARSDAVHNYLLGETGYDDLRTICEQFAGLHQEVGRYVRSQVGVPM